ncbi:MAG: IS91 family transposase, partial [bacterium]
LSSAQRRVMSAIETCRTAALGGHVDLCSNCADRQISYNSCRNRHCPKCQALARAKWLEARMSELLPVPYFHVVFTLPHQLAPLALQNKALLYDLLLRTTFDTLKTIARDPKHLGAEIGGLGILHTWGQNLLHHPHVHCVVPGGGFSPGRDRWISTRPAFFLPVRVLSRLFRRLFLDRLEQLHASTRLEFHGELVRLRDHEHWRAMLAAVRRSEWVVYAKPPFGGPRQVLHYLGGYTHRVAISNNRILDIDGGQVRFLWKDYANHNATRVMTLQAPEFLRRFLLHVLPDRFVRIRHFGFLANRDRGRNLQAARRQIGQPVPTPTHQQAEPMPQHAASTDDSDPQKCRKCGIGRLIRVEILPRQKLSLQPHDSS